jgi:hypothetical protein
MLFPTWRMIHVRKLALMWVLTHYHSRSFQVEFQLPLGGLKFRSVLLATRMMTTRWCVKFDSQNADRTMSLIQPSATSPLFSTISPHWGEHFDKHFKMDLWLTLLSKCSPQWGETVEKKRGLVADGWSDYVIYDCVKRGTVRATMQVVCKSC